MRARIKKEQGGILHRGNSPEVKEFLNVEIEAVRRAAENTGDAETLVILDFLERADEDTFIPLSMTLQISARLAAADGLSEAQWLQQFLGRHASSRARMETLWPTLVELRKNDNLPWPRARQAG